MIAFAFLFPSMVFIYSQNINPGVAIIFFFALLFSYFVIIASFLNHLLIKIGFPFINTTPPKFE